ncbi:hypothetical protein PISMIDRAFT_16785 [Pisolithus microcarpus 441]|uniref:Uncharacterized protein n=1 Tax=Pisolithus microcarpus 441 TaxID=765257 RepID=A0A0C9XRZ6_9AGAM|nr:hypothetical protein PISMIDRAFT_16785 [Pisolithus microcarpus 441]
MKVRAEDSETEVKGLLDEPSRRELETWPATYKDRPRDMTQAETAAESDVLGNRDEGAPEEERGYNQYIVQ